MKAAGTNRKFRHSVVTSANPTEVWSIWIDVEKWGEWDEGLSEAEGTINRIGAEGTIIDKSGRRSPFVVTEYNDGEAYAFKTDLPGGGLIVRRTICDTEPTRFTHEVYFEGFGGFLLSMILGPRFRRVLPLTMKAVADRARELRL